MSDLNLALLGQYKSFLNEKPLGRFRTLRAQALLVYLATEFALGAPHQGRESLMELLWPGMPPDSARTNLRQNLYYLRQTVPNAPPSDGGKAIPFLHSDRQSVAVNPQYPLEFDVQRFGDLLAGPQDKWPEAVALYRGDFLTDFFLPDANTFEEWAAARREAFRRQALNALEGLTNSFVVQGQLNDAEGYARRQLAIDPLRETAYRQLMKVLFWSGRRAEALSLYQECVRILEEELDTPPSEATSALADSIREGTLTGRTEMGDWDNGAELKLSFDKPEIAGAHQQILDIEPPMEQATSTRNNLPVLTTPFIGRETELRALDGFIADPKTRLVTIVGSGGVGKTRLATVAAARVLESGIFPDGLFFIDLASLQERSQILQAVADALNLPLQEGDDGSSWKHLLEYLRQKKMLFLFDSFEHLLGGAALVDEIIEAGPEVTILVTSRERLHLKLEQVYPIDGLTFPEREEAQDAVEYSAVRLFLLSARRIQPDFALDDEELPGLTRICRIVAGMPLALELAASWVDVLSLDEIASELRQGLDILESELLDVPDRQRSVRASFDYSWRKLDEAEQAVFAQLSIFRGGFTREAAQEVTGASLRQLSQLVNKSLLKFDKRQRRYSIHNLLRQYGAQKLGRRSELEAATYTRHSSYYSRLLARYSDDLKGPGQSQALSTIEADLKNVQLAWNHACDQDDIEAIDMALESLWRFYLNFGRSDVKELEKAVAQMRKGEATDAREIVLGRLLAPLGRFYGERGDTAKAKETLEESLEILERAGAVEESLLPLLFLAEVQGSIEESTRLYQEGLALAREIDDTWAIGHVLLFLGWNALEVGDYQGAEEPIGEALKQFKQNGDKGGIAITLVLSGHLALNQGRYKDALAIARESISVTQEFNPGYGKGSWVLAQALFALGEYEAAQDEFRNIVSVQEKRGNRYHVFVNTYWLGEVAFNTGDYSRAAQQFQDSLKGAVEENDLALIIQNHNALGRLDIVQGMAIEARKHFLTALKSAIILDLPPPLLDCLAGIAELFENEDDLDSSALLASLISEHPASTAKTRERGERLFKRIEAELSSPELDAMRQNSREIDLLTVATRLLDDLETP